MSILPKATRAEIRSEALLAMFWLSASRREKTCLLIATVSHHSLALLLAERLDPLANL